MKAKMNPSTTAALMEKRKPAPKTTDTSQETKGNVRLGKRVYAYLDDASHTQFKVFAIQRGTSVDRIIKDAVNTYLLSKGADFQINGTDQALGQTR